MPGRLYAYWLGWADGSSHRLVIALYLRAFGLLAVCACVSLGWQVLALVGSEGILPAAGYFEQVEVAVGPRAFWLLPTLFWWSPTDEMLLGLCIAGTVGGVGLALGVLATASTLLVFVAYLSLVNAGSVFLGYQWDALLVECALLSVFLIRAPALGITLGRLLLFRFMWLAGVVKLVSGDASWRDWSALSYHFETQPLPTALAWHAHHLPDVLLRLGVGITLFVELLVPFLIFAPRWFRQVAAASFIGFELLIFATGSYNFFNLLTIALCLLLLDDRLLQRWIPGLPWLPLRKRGRWLPDRVPRRVFWLPAFIVIALAGLVQVANTARLPTPEWVRAPVVELSRWRAVNAYGVFAVMTTRRREIVLEGSIDGEVWKPWVLPYQPGPPGRAPALATPHQPRLDWQFWFAALRPPESDPWIRELAVRLLTDQQPVRHLFANDPFPDEPPRFVRARFYEYHFTSPEERARTGNWWWREDLGLWMRPIGFRMRVGETVFPE